MGTGGQHLKPTIVGMSAQQNGYRWWRVTAESSRSAMQHFTGLARRHEAQSAIVGMANTPSNNGYWLVASDGGIFRIRRRNRFSGPREASA